jgi:hypothetical protein
VRFYAQASRYAFHFTPDAAVFSFMQDAAGTRGVVLGLRFLGRNPQVVLDGEVLASGDANYLRGNDPSSWRTGLRRYSHVVYRELWPAVDLVLRGDGGTLKYEFRVRPRARIADIQPAYDGANSLTLDDEGALLIDTTVGVLRDCRPVAYQMVAGVRVPVESRYLVKDTQYGFALGAAYNPGLELVIDPGVDYSAFLGGSSHESAYALAVDASGNARRRRSQQIGPSPSLPSWATPR